MDDEDWLNLRDPEEARENLPAGLVVPAVAGGHELRMLDQMRIDLDPNVRDHWRVLFVDEDDNWEKDEGRAEDRPAEVWRVRMSWPIGTSPTPEDAERWLAYRRALLWAKWQPRLAQARQRDEMAARGEGEPG